MNFFFFFLNELGTGTKKLNQVHVIRLNTEKKKNMEKSYGRNKKLSWKNSACNHLILKKLLSVMFTSGSSSVYTVMIPLQSMN